MAYGDKKNPYYSKNKKEYGHPFILTDEGDELNRLNFEHAVDLLQDPSTEYGLLTRCTGLSKSIVKCLAIEGLIIKEAVPGTRAKYYIVSDLGKKELTHYCLKLMGLLYINKYVQ